MAVNARDRGQKHQLTGHLHISSRRSFKAVPSIDKAHVVVLTNYMRRHHALVYQEVAKRVGKLTVLLSTEMEPDRSWDAEWGDLNVVVQKNWMFTARWRHSTGFDEPNFIHVPTDTIRQLRKLKPDIVFSYEMGMRTAFSGLFRMFKRSIPLVMVGNMADHIEQERGVLRRMIRRFVRSRVDFATYNGPSCQRYLQQIGFADEQLFHFPYCIDFDKTHSGAQSFSDDGSRHLIYTGAISSRKHILPFARLLKEYLASHDHLTVTLSIAGTGPLADDVSALTDDRLTINLLGNCDPTQLAAAYQAADVCVFPTLGDEWGLVPVEAMASGLPVLGSSLAQSVEALVVENENGWVFDPRDDASLSGAIDRCLSTPTVQLETMSKTARQSVAHCTPEVSASKFCHVIREISGDVQLAGIDQTTEPPILPTENAVL